MELKRRDCGAIEVNGKSVFRKEKGERRKMILIQITEKTGNF